MFELVNMLEELGMLRLEVPMLRYINHQAVLSLSVRRSVKSEVKTEAEAKDKPKVKTDQV